ncbi:MAG: 4-hydroxy-3-methylbut-2-enyl diphosphate reductase [Bacteroidales bacterium]|jgi:4-hydroxy-3-methylbut-2-enyl diphosphate reductase|nr:4-hydroxy-3-methylbut-2-enyl diphosphate reductase [Bacteroidales bacterium]
MIIEIDPAGGFCFGVVKAIETAERLIREGQDVYCLGEIVHNEHEVKRLASMGMNTTCHNDIPELKNRTLLIRAHGEPTETYSIASSNNIRIVDATCPIVLKLQKKIREGFKEMERLNGQVVLFGQAGHPEVIGLNSQTENTAIIISGSEEMERIDFTRPIRLFAQTTKDKIKYQKLAGLMEDAIASSGENSPDFKMYKTICGQVSDRIPKLIEFAKKHDVIVFAGGKESSNAKVLFQQCLAVNHRTHFVSGPEEIEPSWFLQCNSVGISGATSTPRWLMEEIKRQIAQMNPEISY